MGGRGGVVGTGRGWGGGFFGGGGASGGGANGRRGVCARAAAGQTPVRAAGQPPSARPVKPPSARPAKPPFARPAKPQRGVSDTRLLVDHVLLQLQPVEGVLVERRQGPVEPRVLADLGDGDPGRGLGIWGFGGSRGVRGRAVCGARPGPGFWGQPSPPPRGLPTATPCIPQTTS